MLNKILKEWGGVAMILVSASLGSGIAGYLIGKDSPEKEKCSLELEQRSKLDSKKYCKISSVYSAVATFGLLHPEVKIPSEFKINSDSIELNVEGAIMGYSPQKGIYYAKKGNIFYSIDGYVIGEEAIACVLVKAMQDNMNQSREQLKNQEE